MSVCTYECPLRLWQSEAKKHLSCKLLRRWRLCCVYSCPWRRERKFFRLLRSAGLLFLTLRLKRNFWVTRCFQLKRICVFARAAFAAVALLKCLASQMLIKLCIESGFNSKSGKYVAGIVEVRFSYGKFVSFTCDRFELFLIYGAYPCQRRPKW